MFALRSRDAGHVVDGLAALTIARADDFRDRLPAIAILHHAATRINADPDRLFRGAEALAGTEYMGTQLRHLREQTPEERDVHHHGYSEVETVTGIGLIRWGCGTFAPTVDLTRLVVEIAGRIDGDGYPAQPEIATSLYSFWFSRNSGDQERLGEALRTIWASRPFTPTHG